MGCKSLWKALFRRVSGYPWKKKKKKWIYSILSCRSCQDIQVEKKKRYIFNEFLMLWFVGVVLSYFFFFFWSLPLNLSLFYFIFFSFLLCSLVYVVVLLFSLFFCCLSVSLSVVSQGKERETERSMWENKKIAVTLLIYLFILPYSKCYSTENVQNFFFFRLTVRFLSFSLSFILYFFFFRCLFSMSVIFHCFVVGTSLARYRIERLLLLRLCRCDHTKKKKKKSA